MPTKSLTLSVNVCDCDWKLEGIRLYRISDYKFICPARNLISCWSQVTTLPTFTISMRIQFLWYQSIDGWIYRIFEEGIESLGHHFLYIYCIGRKISFPNLVSKCFAPCYKSPIDFAQLLFFLKETKNGICEGIINLTLNSRKIMSLSSVRVYPPV